MARAQKIVENKIDEFTKHRVIRTSWEELAYKFNGSMYAHTRLSHIDSIYFLELKYVGNSTNGMMEDAEFMLKLSNDSIVTLRNLKYKLQCTGCGAIGINSAGRLGLDVDFKITPEQLRLLSNNNIVKVRIYLSGGFIEEEISNKDGGKLPKQAALILSSPPR